MNAPQRHLAGLEKAMRNRFASVIVAVVLSYATGCSNLTTPEHRAATASAIGASGGLAVGLMAGAPLIGALIGGGAGAAIGALTNS